MSFQTFEKHSKKRDKVHFLNKKTEKTTKKPLKLVSFVKLKCLKRHINLFNRIQGLPLNLQIK
jgi:hypothetical protein